MKLCQFFLPGKGRRTGVIEGSQVIDVTSRKAKISSVVDLIVRGKSCKGIERLARQLTRESRVCFAWSELDRTPSPRKAHLLGPLDPPEVWGAGITYKRSMQYYSEHASQSDRSKGVYDYVYESDRPEIFFKATASRTVGPNASIGIRQDSNLTAVEAELAIIIGSNGQIVGYTAGNDCSAWDIERENSLFLAQSKIFDSCFALGPVLVTSEEIADPHRLALSCTIWRGGKQLYKGHVNTREMKRSCQELVDWLCRSNVTPAGTVLSTGTGIPIPDKYALKDGDVVEIDLEGVGTLRNRVRKLP